MKKFISFKEFLNEQKVESRGKKPVNIMVGRFQPFHIGHWKAAKELHDQNGLPVVIVSVRGGKKGKGTDFSKSLSDKMIKDLIRKTPFLEDMIEIKYVAFDVELFANLRPKYEPVLMGAGEDRFKAYKNQMTSFRDKKGNWLNMRDDFDIFQTSRSASGTEVRDLIKNGNKKGFEKLMPPVLHNYWNAVSKELNENFKKDKLFSLKKNIEVHEKALKKLKDSGKKDKMTLETMKGLLIKKTQLIKEYHNLVK